MILSQIAACSNNRVIGRENRLPWHLPEDLKFFKEKTAGKIIIMGRKTFDSFPKMLPKRFHIVISRNQKAPYENTNLKFVSSLDEATRLAKNLTGEWGEEVFIIGGAEIYRLSMAITDRIYLTEIDKNFDGDAYFPELGREFKLTAKRSSKDGETTYHFCQYDRELQK